jgi:hypothetical protein
VNYEWGYFLPSNEVPHQFEKDMPSSPLPLNLDGCRMPLSPSETVTIVFCIWSFIRAQLGKRPAQIGLLFIHFSFCEGRRGTKKGNSIDLKRLGKIRIKFRGRKDLGDITVEFKNKVLEKISEIVRGFWGIKNLCCRN